MTAPLSLKEKTFFDHFPAPKYLLLSTTGVSITDRDIRSIRFGRRMFGNCLKITHFSSTPTPAGAVDAGFIHDSSKLSETLGEIAYSADLGYIHATLPEEKAYLFTAAIDKVPYEGLRDAVAFIVEENVPVTLADSVFEFEVIKEVENGTKLKIAVSVLPKKVVNAYIEVFENAGLTPISFIIESQAIARALIAHGDMRTHLIVNLGEKKAGFYIAESEVVQFTTTLAYSVEGDHFHNLSDLKMELRKIFAFWNAREDSRGFPQGSIERVLVTGIGALQSEFVKELMNECPVEAALANAWVNAPCLDQRFSQKDGLLNASAIGLALPRENRHV